MSAAVSASRQRLPGIPDCALCGKADRPSVEVDERPHRGFSQRLPRPRQTSPRRRWRSTETANFWASAPQSRQYRRVLPIGSGAGDQQSWRAVRRLYDAGGHVEVIGVMSNSHPTAPYRGQPAGSVVHHRGLIDIAARELGHDPIDLRRRNLIPTDALPFKTSPVFTYDSGNFGKI